MVSPLLPELLSLKAGESAESVEDPWTDVVDEVCSVVEVADLRHRLEKLPARERTVISLRYGIGGTPKTYRAIARDLEVALGTVCNIEKRALSMLQAAYAATTCAATSAAA
jgi:RNA polymerase sigma factor (sigma-70 family)